MKRSTNPNALLKGKLLPDIKNRDDQSFYFRIQYRLHQYIRLDYHHIFLVSRILYRLVNFTCFIWPHTQQRSNYSFDLLHIENWCYFKEFYNQVCYYTIFFLARKKGQNTVSSFSLVYRQNILILTGKPVDERLFPFPQFDCFF